MNIPVIYEDDCVVVIEKPSGIVSNRAETVKEKTLQDWMEEKYGIREKKYEGDGEVVEYFKDRDGLVHRLDRETSGVMVFAKNPECFTELLRQFKEREVSKEYMALTHGLWKVKEGEVSLPVGRMRADRKKFGVREDGRPSVSRYQVVGEYRSWEFPKEVDDRGYGGFSLVEFEPKTGRTHQIRVHARHLGHPLVGDGAYAGRKRSREDRKWAKRLMLHAKSLQFRHPKSGEMMKFETKGSEIREVIECFSLS